MGGAVNTELLLVFLHLLILSEVLNEFQKYENGSNMDAICTLHLFAAKNLSFH